MRVQEENSQRNKGCSPRLGPAGWTAQSATRWQPLKCRRKSMGAVLEDMGSEAAACIQSSGSNDVRTQLDYVELQVLVLQGGASRQWKMS